MHAFTGAQLSGSCDRARECNSRAAGAAGVGLPHRSAERMNSRPEKVFAADDPSLLCRAQASIRERLGAELVSWSPAEIAETARLRAEHNLKAAFIRRGLR